MSRRARQPFVSRCAFRRRPTTRRSLPIRGDPPPPPVGQSQAKRAGAPTTSEPAVVNATDCTTSVANGGAFTIGIANACAPDGGSSTTSISTSSGDNHASPHGVGTGAIGNPASVKSALPGSPVSATDIAVAVCDTVTHGITPYWLAAGPVIVPITCTLGSRRIAPPVDSMPMYVSGYSDEYRITAPPVAISSPAV